MANLFAPAERTFALSDRPVQPGPLYAFPIRCLGAAAIASVCLGIGRGAIDALVALVRNKVPVGSRTRLAERAMVQEQVARAEATLRAARALLLNAAEEMWRNILAERTISQEQRALRRLAATHACESAVQVTDQMSKAAGTSATSRPPPATSASSKPPTNLSAASSSACP